VVQRANPTTGDDAMVRDDRVLVLTRGTAAVVVAALVAAVAILYGVPGETERWWAWPIDPDLTALVMGAGYASGAYFFVRVLTTRSWRSVTLGFLPIAGFTWFMLLATVLHWDRFTPAHPAFVTWTILYAVTPILVPVVWAINRPRDPGREPGELLLPHPARVALAAGGAVVLLLAVSMMATPTALVDRWPWQLSPLTARVISSYLVLSGGSLVALAWDARWRCAKVLTETFALGAGLLALAVVRDWEALRLAEPMRWANLGAWIAALLALLAARLGVERRARADVGPTAAPHP
jgi:hypothetical protein